MTASTTTHAWMTRMAHARPQSQATMKAVI
jgi:hypothetical protein